ncbi:MAG TPA: mersacidin/lichenicidin family type 2 lantibiotic [Candidatus Angelobacter sp.]|nr:mersacidin/lichenicidin family type 2 lantibiotic [Candidatus Angelobacter sp.]
MSELDIVKAWKDVSYRRSLSAQQLAQIPNNPAGAIEISQSSSMGKLTPICTRIISDPCGNC